MLKKTFRAGLITFAMYIILQPNLHITTLIMPIASAETDLSGMLIKNNSVTGLYKISPGDILTFGLNEEPEFEQTNIIVRRDGFATIRPLGEVYVANSDIQTLNAYLESKLDHYVKNPEVYINIQQFHTPKIYIFGAVTHPGLYQPTKKSAPATEKLSNDISLVPNEGPKLTISNVLSNSGGVNYEADLSNIQVIKQDQRVISINLIDLFLHHDITQDILLEEGDTIQVSKLDNPGYGDREFLILSSAGIYPQQFPIRILGEVEKPGMFYISTDTPYLNTALALASGYKTNAVKQSVMIKRLNNKNQIYNFFVNPQKADLVLRPNDVIEVKDKHSAKTVRGIETVARITQPFLWSMGTWAAALK